MLVGEYDAGVSCNWSRRTVAKGYADDDADDDDEQVFLDVRARLDVRAGCC